MSTGRCLSKASHLRRRSRRRSEPGDKPKSGNHETTANDASARCGVLTEIELQCNHVRKASDVHNNTVPYRMAELLVELGLTTNWKGFAVPAARA